MPKKLYSLLLVLAALGAPSAAKAVCFPVLPTFGEPIDPVASAAFQLCLQQQRQAEQQRQQMEAQRRQMQAQTFQMQEQARIQKQQLELQRQQLEAQRQLLVQQSQATAPESPSLNLGRYLAKISEAVNADTPLRLDDNTVLVRAEIINNSMFFIHKTTYEVSGQQDINRIAKYLGPKVCKEPDFKNNVNNLMIKYTYRYFMPSGKYFDVFWEPGSC